MRYAQIIIFVGILIFSGCGAGKYGLMLEQSKTLLQNREYNRAKSEVLKMIEKFPDKPEPYYLLGLINFAGEHYGECLSNFEKAESFGIQKTPELYINKGLALYRTGNKAEAEKVFSIASKSGSSGIANKYLGIIRYELGDYADAVEAFRNASSMNNDTGSLHIFGNALYRLGMNEESLDIFMKAHDSAPENDVLTFQTANLLMLNSRYSDAEIMYSNIPAESVFKYDSIYNQAEANIKVGNFRNAEYLLTTYLNMRPDDYEALFNLSAVQIKNGKYVYAADNLSKLIENDSFKVRGGYNLGLVSYKLGKYPEAVLYLAEVVDIDKKNSSYRYAYGLALSENGNFEEARAQMKAILEIDPGNAAAIEWLNRHPE